MREGDTSRTRTMLAKVCMTALKVLVRSVQFWRSKIRFLINFCLISHAKAFLSLFVHASTGHRWRN